jgi:DNA-binding NtrC family response regulator
MAKKTKLSDEDRGFFDLVARAAFCNPFGEERSELDLKIAGCRAETPHDKRIDIIIQRVQEKILGLAGDGRADLRLYSAEDRNNLQAAFMFDIFHRVSRLFDTLIQDQIKFGQDPCPVPFARETLTMFSERGFSIPESIRFFAMLYQIRRAFYFINGSLIGSSPSMSQLRLHLWNNVFTHDIRWYEQYLWNRMEDFSTLLLGETGTGKGTAAAAIGRSGFIPYDEKKGCFAESFTRNFIAINLSQFAESLIESELFGHKKGAFTGAVEHHQGVFSRCTPHGSIFLDEIGDISVPIQVKLLQVLQDRTFVPVGSHQQLRFSGRVIAATNRPLDELRRRGQFREDLFYRLCSDVIVVPSLRQRLREESEELDRMIIHVVTRIVGEGSEELVQMVREVIENELGPGYSWPGNVRELEQAVRRILLTKRIGPDSGKDQSQDCTPCLFSRIENGAMSARELLEKYCMLLYEKFGSYEEVSRRTRLDRRTVKKYILYGLKVRQDGLESITEEPR